MCFNLGNVLYRSSFFVCVETRKFVNFVRGELNPVIEKKSENESGDVGDGRLSSGCVAFTAPPPSTVLSRLS